MEPLSSDDSCDSEMKNMKSLLNEFGLEDENLSKEEMSDLLKALNNSKSSVMEEELKRNKMDDDNNKETATSRKPMKRRYLNVRDRRMPWSLLPSDITQSEKARVLSVYIKLMAINSYKRARLSCNFASWPPPIQIVEESSRVQPVRSTRSGRSVPVYEGFDDDSSDLDFVVTKSKKRKVNCEGTNSDGLYPNKVISLKRKPSKEENSRPLKESKLCDNNDKVESTVSLSSNVKSKKPFLTFIED